MDRLDPASASAQKPATKGSAESDFARFYRENRSYVASVLRRRGVPGRDVEDRVHEVFLVAWQRRARVWSWSEGRFWLARIASHLACNDSRRFYRRSEILVEDLPDLAVWSRIEERLDVARTLRCAMGRLSARMRPVVVGYWFHGLPMREIARRQGIQLKSAYARLKLSRRRLTRLFRR